MRSQHPAPLTALTTDKTHLQFRLQASYPQEQLLRPYRLKQEF